MIVKKEAILKLIREAGLEGKLGVSRLHKHFDLNEKERVFWKRNSKGKFESSVIN